MDYDRGAMHELILDLIQACPNLRVLDRVDKHDEYDPLRELIIRRHQIDDILHIDYTKVQRPSRYVFFLFHCEASPANVLCLRRKPFDVMDGMFD